MDLQEQLSKAIDELEAGRTAEAQGILVDLVKRDPKFADAWLALSFCFDDQEKKKYCLEKVVSIQPENTFARQELDQLTGAAGAAAIAAAGLGAYQAPPSETPVDQFAPDSDFTPAFTPDSMSELIEEADDASASFESFDYEVSYDIQGGQEGVALDPWEIPHADPSTGPGSSTQVPVIEQTGSPTEPASWEITGEKPQATTAARGKKARESGTKSYSWFEVWFMVLFSPSERTFQKIISDPNATPGRGFLWVFITSFISLFTTILLYALRMQTMLPQIFAARPELASVNPNQILGYVLIGMIVGSPIMAGLAILGVILQAAFYQFIAKFMIGEGTFAEMAYALSAIFAPLTLLGVIFSLPIFFLNVAGGLLGLYGLFLTLVAIKGVNRLGWGGSCAVLVGVPILISACSCLVFYLIFASGAGLNNLPIQLTPIP